MGSRKVSFCNGIKAEPASTLLVRTFDDISRLSRNLDTSLSIL